MKQVAIVIATYNPKWEKLKNTIMSTLVQESIDYEIVIADDGSSSTEFFSDVESLLSKIPCVDYKFVKHKNNQGTVKNIYDALEVCEAEYVYIISPGDFFYDVHTLCNLYHYCESNQYDICFGNAVHYKKIEIYNQVVDLTEAAVRHPYDVAIYSKNNKRIFDILTLSNNNILGAAYFRKLTKFKYYLGEFVGIVKYMEDYPTLMLSVIEGERIGYFNSYIIWYEYGDGISTAGSDKWKNLLDGDFRNACKHLLEMQVKNSYATILKFISLSGHKEKLIYLLMHPSILIKKIYIVCRQNLIGKTNANKEEVDYKIIDEIAQMCKCMDK